MSRPNRRSPRTTARASRRSRRRWLGLARCSGSCRCPAWRCRRSPDHPQVPDVNGDHEQVSGAGRRERDGRGVRPHHLDERPRRDRGVGLVRVWHTVRVVLGKADAPAPDKPQCQQDSPPHAISLPQRTRPMGSRPRRNRRHCLRAAAGSRRRCRDRATGRGRRRRCTESSVPRGCRRSRSPDRP